MDADSPAERVLHFPDGIPGFPDHERFVLVELTEGGAFQRLQSIDDADVAMFVCVPWLFFPEYAPELTSTEQEELAIERPEDALVFCSVTLDLEAKRVYVNLLGPFVVNADTRRGRQLVLAGTDYPTRAPVDLSAAQMIVLSRRQGESIVIGGEVVVTIVEVRGGQVRIGIDAPRSVEVHREEVYYLVARENIEAVRSAGLDPSVLFGAVAPDREG